MCGWTCLENTLNTTCADTPQHVRWTFRCRKVPFWMTPLMGAFADQRWMLQHMHWSRRVGYFQCELTWAEGSPHVTVIGLPPGKDQRIQIYRMMTTWQRLRLVWLWLWCNVETVGA